MLASPVGADTHSCGRTSDKFQENFFDQLGSDFQNANFYGVPGKLLADPNCALKFLPCHSTTGIECETYN